MAENMLDGVQVPRMGRQVEHAGAGGSDCFGDAGDLVGREIVHHHVFAGGESGREELLGPLREGGLRRGTPHRSWGRRARAVR